MTAGQLTRIIAEDFSTRLRLAIGEAHLREVVQRNATPAYAGCCATHDFCDANHYMFEAFCKHVGRPFRFGNEEDQQYWDKAWALAKKKKFYLPR